MFSNKNPWKAIILNKGYRARIVYTTPFYCALVPKKYGPLWLSSIRIKVTINWHSDCGSTCEEKSASSACSYCTQHWKHLVTDWLFTVKLYSSENILTIIVWLDNFYNAKKASCSKCIACRDCQATGHCTEWCVNLITNHFRKVSTIKKMMINPLYSSLLVHYACVNRLVCPCWTWRYIFCWPLALQHGTNVLAANQAGDTPLDLAIRFNRTGECIHAPIRHSLGRSLTKP